MNANAVLLDRLLSEGLCESTSMLDGRAAKELLGALTSNRRFDESIFLTEAEWDSGPKTHRATNPGPGFNALERVPEKLEFIEKNQDLRALFTSLLGENFRVLSKKLVCRLSWSVVPEWLKRRLKGKACNTLGAYIQPSLRDLVYFLENDLHQDIQDWNRMPMSIRDHRYVTLYVYLADVGSHEAPVHMLPRSHLLGATHFQHDVRRDASTGTWTYSDGRGGEVRGELTTVTGAAGHMGIWHPSLIHGGPVVRTGRSRISLRYLVGRDPAATACVLDELDRQIRGPLYLEDDQTPGARADSDGQWSMILTDFIRYGYEREGMTP